MPIDSPCAGCGKTLRVNDEFVGRKARCPLCGNVYVVGGGQIASEASISKTSFAPQSDWSSATGQPNPDSWSSLPTEKPPLAQPIDSNISASVPQVLEPTTPVKYFVRTPNTMVYGPSDRESVLDWIAQGRLDDTCHIREETSEQWIGMAAWRFQTRKVQTPTENPRFQNANAFGSVPVSSNQSTGYPKAGNGNVVLVLGLVSWLLCPTAIGSWVCSILAIYFATIELGKMRSGVSPDKEKTIVLIGMWLGILNLVAWVLAFIGLVITVIVSN